MMIFRMLRTQTGSYGTFRMGVAYDAGKNQSHIKTAKGFIQAGLAEQVSPEALKKEKETAEKLASEAVKSGKGAKSKEKQ